MSVSFDVNLLRDEDQERITRSAALIANPLSEGHYLRDNMFLLAQVARQGNVVTVDIDRDTPTVTFDQSVSDAINDKFARRIPTIRQYTGRQGDMRYTLLSGGSMIWVRQGEESRLALLQRQIYVRDNPALGYVLAPGQYVTPSGGVGERILHAALREGAEELLLLVKRGSAMDAFNQLAYQPAKSDAVPALLSYNGLTMLSVAEKMQSVRDVQQALTQRGAGQDFPQSVDIPVVLSVRERPEDADRLCTVVTRVNGRTVEECRCVPYQDSTTMRVHFNIPYEVELPVGLEIAAYNAEAPGRAVRLMSEAEMQAQMQATPDPNGVGAIFKMVAAYLRKDCGDAPADMRNANGLYEGSFAAVQRVLAQRLAVR